VVIVVRQRRSLRTIGVALALAVVGVSVALAGSLGADEALAATPPGLRSVATGIGFACAVASDRTVECWGSNDVGQLGNGTTTDSSVPVRVDGVASAVSVAAGFRHACALLAGGGVVCWGADSSGQLGDGTFRPYSTRAVRVIHLGNVVSIAAGGYQSCALRSNKQVWCWGRTVDFSPSSPESLSTPVEVLTLTESISVGDYYACAVTTTHNVACWGTESALFTTSRNFATTVPGLSGVKVVSMGTSSACVVLDTSQVKCWGYNTYGEAGQPAMTTVSHPSIVGVAAGAATVTVANTTTCAVFLSGSYTCWGDNSAGIYGNGSPGTTPSDFAELSIGDNFACSVSMSSVVRCWGDNSRGQLGVGSHASDPGFVPTTPNPVVGLGPGPVTDRFAFDTLTPARLLDTRPLAVTTDGQFAGSGKVAAGGVVALRVVGRGGVPSGASTVALNVTATQPGGPGYITVWPCGQDRPEASNLNLTTGVTVANLVISGVGADGAVCLYTSVATHLIADMSGSVSGVGVYPLRPARLLDTRPGRPTVDGLASGGGALSAGSELAVSVLNRGGVAGGASSAALNITATDAHGSGYITVWPCGQNRPEASNLNVSAGSTVANSVISGIGSGGTVCIFTSVATNVVLDVSGYLAGPSFTPLSPARLLDTRPGRPTVDGQAAGTGLTGGTRNDGFGVSVYLTVAGRGGVPAGASSVVLNVTATEPGEEGFVTVWPCEGTRPGPLSSNLNVTPGSTVANLVVVRIGDRGTVCLSSYKSTHLIADVAGYFN
jgi:alpha-tubulin suppressor-like RCC1 family protein